MLHEKITEYYLEKDYNCSESVLRILNDRYALGLGEADFKLVSGFGGGCGCGIVCGALAGAIAAMGSKMVNQRAHEDPAFKTNCGAFCTKFAEKLGGTDCAVVRPLHFREGVRCAEVVEAAVECFDAFLAEKANG